MEQTTLTAIMSQSWVAFLKVSTHSKNALGKHFFRKRITVSRLQSTNLRFLSFQDTAHRQCLHDGHPKLFYMGITGQALISRGQATSCSVLKHRKSSSHWFWFTWCPDFRVRLFEKKDVYSVDAEMIFLKFSIYSPQSEICGLISLVVWPWVSVLSTQ